MDASNLTDVFQYVQRSPTLRHMLAPCSVVPHPSFERPVCVQPDGVVLCAPGRVEPATAWFSARLALEVAALVRAGEHGGVPEGGAAAQPMARLLLAAARVTACAWRTGPFCPAGRAEPMPCSWGAALVGREVPSAPDLARCVADVAFFVAPALRPHGVDAQDLHGWACSAWPVLQPAEWLVVQGGDERLDLAAHTGLNRYGCQSFPRYGELDFSSSTASTPTLPAARAIHQAGIGLIRLAVDGQGAGKAVEEVKAFLAAFYHLDGPARVVLAPSGTDCALAATALMGLATPRLTTILPGAEETGSGVPLATCGRHFASRTARGHAVCKGVAINGFAQDAEHVTLPLRGKGGERVPDDALFAACAQHMARAVREGRRVLLYLLHVSKTGQLVLPASRVRALCALHPGKVDVLVDACQARLRPHHVRQYMDWGWAVMVTGSKFFTGPPFSGALFLPDAWLERLRQNSLPAGLAAYATRAEWPDLPATRILPTGLNAGLFLRWSGARAEMAAFAAVGDGQKYTRLHQFMVAAEAALGACPFVRLLPSAPQPVQPEEWDSLPSIFAFAVLAHGGVLDLAQARRLHGLLLADLTAHLPAGAGAAERALAALPCHVGQPVAIATAEGGEEGMGALRVSASARHVSGTGGLCGTVEDGQTATPDHPVARMLAKLGLILHYWPDLADLEGPAPAHGGSASQGCGAGVAQPATAQGWPGISSLALGQS